MIEIGVRYLNSFLKNNGVKTREIHLALNLAKENPNFENLYEQINPLVRDSQFVGLSYSSSYASMAFKISQLLKKHLPNTTLIHGGVHPTIATEESLQYADFVCVGEGENTLLNLIKNKADRNYVENIQGLFSKKHKNKTINKTGIKWISNLDQLPFPHYGYEEVYIRINSSIIAAEKDMFKKHFKGTYYIIGSRGCPFNCSYCFNGNPTYSSRDSNKVRFYRKRTLKNIIAELAHAKINFKVDRVIFEDDDFMDREDEEIKVFAEWYEESINLPFSICATFRNTNRAKTEILSKYLYRVIIGIQSANENILKMYHRKLDKQKVLETTKLMIEYKIPIFYDIIIENPWERDEDKTITVEFLNTLPKKNVFIRLFKLQLFPGTQLYKKALEENIPIDKIKPYSVWEVSALNTLYLLSSSFRLPVGIFKYFCLFRNASGVNVILKNLCIPIQFVVFVRRLIFHIRRGNRTSIFQYKQLFLSKIKFY